MARAIAITSGKGGVGKTNAATNIGAALARLGRRVCLFDADLGLANVNILTGQAPSRTVENLLDGDATLKEIILSGPHGMHIVPSGSGVESLAGLDPEKAATLKTALSELEETHDYLLIDTAAGLGVNVLGFVRSAHEAAVVVTPEPTAITDAYGLIKVLHRQGYDKPISIIVNMALGPEEGARVYYSLNNAAKKFLGRELRYLGHVVRDSALLLSVQRQSPVTVLFPESDASRCFERLALAIDSGGSAEPLPPFSAAWTSALSRMEPAPRHPVEKKPEESLESSLSRFLAVLESGAVEEIPAKEAMGKLEAAYIRRFGTPWSDPRTCLYNLLDFSEVSSSFLKEAVELLEAIHERRYSAPVREIEDAMLKALWACDSEKRMQNLLILLEEGYRRKFSAPPVSLEERLAREVREESLEPEGIARLLALLDGAHRARTGAPLKLPGQVPIEDVGALAEKFGESERDLGGLLTSLEALSLTREEILRRLRELSGEGP